MKRRHFIAGLTAASGGLLAPRFGWADAGALALLVAGPDGEQTSRWGDALALAMAPGFPGNPAILAQPDGGLDGVTGGNRLDALVVPDGKTAAILPGGALIAWLTGDPRVHFDPTRWVPVAAGSNSGVLVVRLGPGQTPTLQTLQSIAPLQLAADGPQSNDLAALLALERAGIRTAPVFGLRGTEAKTRAFVAGEANAVFLCGEGVPEDIAPLTANGGVPVFCLGNTGLDGNVQPDPLFPGLADAISFGGSISSPLDASYHAAAAAARTDFIMVLPKLTDPGAVSLWRAAASRAIAAPALAAAASASSISLQSAAAVTAALGALNVVLGNQAGLQSFLSARFGWQPG